MRPLRFTQYVVVLVLLLVLITGCSHHLAMKQDAAFERTQTARGAAATASPIPTATVPIPTQTPVVIMVTATPAVAAMHTIKGNLLIQPGYHYETYDDRICLSGCGEDGAPCTGIEGYADLRTGTQVTVRNAFDQVISVGELKTGSLELEPGAPYWGRCRLPLVITNVPDADFYTLSIGSRPEITFSHDELVSLNWRVALTVGEPDW